jgi:hypothetical protein
MLVGEIPVFQCCCPVGDSPEIIGKQLEHGYKSPEEMIDPLSTGRKAAAVLKPITEGLMCEWANLSFAGGGVLPIVGCLGNPAKHIHHGPDKDTTNNSDLNLHRICSKCHNRWHSINDPHYGARPPAGTPFVPIDAEWVKHDPTTPSTPELIFASETWWNTKAKNRKISYDSAVAGRGSNLDRGNAEERSNPDFALPAQPFG